jgi:hypothetical protein
MFLALLAGLIALQTLQWRRLARGVSSGLLTKRRAMTRYVVWALAPIFSLAAAFLAAVGLEEWLGVAIVSRASESTIRAAPFLGIILLGLAGLGSVGFVVRCVWLKRT